jgi:hypothetical protein
MSVYLSNLSVYQYSETNFMHFLFNLLRIKGLYMFRELLVHPQEALKWNDITRMQYPKCRSLMSIVTIETTQLLAVYNAITTIVPALQIYSAFTKEWCGFKS